MNLKRHLATGLAVACLVLGGAIAQNLTKSIQLSQDPTGPFGVDTLNGVFFSNHVNTNQVASPTISNFGTSPTLTGTDTAGEIIEGSGTVTTGTLTFARAYTATPYCVGQSSSSASPIGLISSPNGFIVTHNASAALLRMYYSCTGGRVG